MLIQIHQSTHLKQPITCKSTKAIVQEALSSLMDAVGSIVQTITVAQDVAGRSYKLRYLLLIYVASWADAKTRLALSICESCTFGEKPNTRNGGQ
jgi:hypothetical protein